MKPIKPFEPISTDTIPEGSSWVGQVKWDGVRVLIYYDGVKTQLYNRKLRQRTFHYPELLESRQYCAARSIILDGEIIALKEGKPSFAEVMKRDGITNWEKVAHLSQRVPITYMAFDVLYLNGQWITSWPLAQRQEALEKYLRPNDHVQLVESFSQIAPLYEAVKEAGLEGVVIKDLNSSYAIGGKDERWQKKKNYQDLIAVVGGAGFRGQWINSLLLGLYDGEGKLWYIGSGGTGKLTQEDWVKLTKAIEPLIQEKSPFVNPPSRRQKVRWLKPCLTVKVQFTEWLKGNRLRHPSIQAFTQIPPHECFLPG